MSGLGTRNIDDVLTFSVNTHTPTTGAATDADSVPSYRVYEDETGTAILTGSMAKLDDANTTGYYSEQLTLSAANGFENGKSYNIYVSAAVGGVTGTKSFQFQVALQKVNVTQVGGQTASASAAVDFDDLATVEGLASGATGFAAIDTVVDGIKAVTDNLPESGALTTIDANIDAILVDTGTTIPALFPANFADLAITVTTGLVSVGTNNDKTGYSISGTLTTLDALDTAQDSQHSTTQSNIAALNNLSAADVNAQVDLALADYDGPTNTEMVAAFTEIKGATWSSSTDTLEAIRDRGDAAWTTGAGGTPPDLLQSTTIATLASQTSFTLTAGSADNDAYNGAVVIVTDSATSTQKAVGSVSDYVGSTRTVTLAADPGIFTMAVGDTIDIIAATGTGPTAAAIRAEIDSNSTQLAAILADTAEIGAAGAGLTAIPWNAAWDAEVQSECADALTAYSVVATSDLPTNFADLAITVTTGLVSVGSLANDSIAEATFQAGAITSSVLDAAAITANNIATNAITSAKIATDAIGSAQLAATAITEIQAGLATSASIAALNNISAADVNAQVDLALADYDGPTNTEMVAAFTEIKGATWSSSTDTLEQIRDNLGAGGGDATEAKQDTIIAALGTPVDLGDGATIAGGLTSIAGKTSNAGSYSRSTDSLEAIKDSGAAGGDATLANQTTIISLLGAGDVTVANPVISATVIQLDEGDTYDGTARALLSWTVTKDYTTATSVTLEIWRDNADGTRTAMKSVTASVVNSTTITASFTATFDADLDLDGCPLFEKLRFGLVASWSGDEETIAKGDCYVYGRE